MQRSACRLPDHRYVAEIAAQYPVGVDIVASIGLVLPAGVIGKYIIPVQLVAITPQRGAASGDWPAET